MIIIPMLSIGIIMVNKDHRTCADFPVSCNLLTHKDNPGISVASEYKLPITRNNSALITI